MRRWISNGLLLLVLSGTGLEAEARPAAAPPASKAAVAGAGEDPLANLRARLVIQEQQLTLMVEANLRKARLSHPADPVAADKLLRKTLLQVWDDPDIRERTRDDLLRKVVAARRALSR